MKHEKTNDNINYVVQLVLIDSNNEILLNKFA